MRVGGRVAAGAAVIPKSAPPQSAADGATSTPDPSLLSSTTEMDPEAAAPAVTAPAEWKTGTQFSRYQMDSLLATGGMAEIWRARIKGAGGFEKRIAIKTMHTRFARHPDIVQMFINEAALAARLSHPNIVQVFDFGQLEGRYFIAMEYVPGVTLRFAHKRMLARGARLPIAATLHVMIDVCEALHVLHELSDRSGPLGFVHRDLSPDNVIIATSGAARLIDFGAARPTARTPTPSAFVGKYRYAAPERVRRADEDRRSDIYSVGVILFECLTGARPFDGPDARLIEAITAGPMPDPRRRLPTLPVPIAEVVMTAMARDPGERFATARELAAALGGCVAALGGANKERDVTSALSALLETPAETPPPVLVPLLAEGVPEAIELRSEVSSEPDPALCEVEIVEASGSIQMIASPPPPPARARVAARPPPPPRWARLGEPSLLHAAPRGSTMRGWRTKPAESRRRDPKQLAVELFDRGLELRAAGRYGEALDAWEKARALAPENSVYQSNVDRLRDQLDNLRRAERELAGWERTPPDRTAGD